MTVKNNKLVDELFAVGAHFGYSKSKRDPSVKNYIYTNKDGVDVIDLEKTAEAILEAREKVNSIIKKGGKILIVGNKAEIKDIVPGLARNQRSIFYVNNRWIGGTLTNFDEIQKRVKKLALLIKDSETGAFNKYTKREALGFQKEIEKMRKYYEGLLDLYEKPSLLIVVDAKDEEIAIAEAKKTNIPVIAITNTDTNIKEIELPIVANDRSRQTIEKILKEILPKPFKAKRNFNKK